MPAIVKKIWGIYKPLRRAFIGIFIILFITIGLDFVWPYIYGRTIDAVIQGKSLHTLLVFLSIAFGVMLIQNLISWLGGILQLTYVDYDSPTLVSNLSLKHLLTLSVGQHRNEHSSLTQSVVSDGQNGTHNLLNLTVYQFLPYALRVVIGLIVLFIFSWELGLVVFVGVLISAVVIYVSNMHFMPYIRAERDMDQEIDKRRMEVLRNAPLVISNSSQDETMSEIMNQLEEINDYGKSFWRKYFRIAYVVRPTIQDVTLIISIGVAALLVAHGQLSAGLILTVILWTNTVLINMSSLGGLQRQVLFASERARKYFNILDVQSDVGQAKSPIVPATVNGQITFDDVSFMYSSKRIIEDDEERSKRKKAYATPPLPREALKHLSFDIRAGEHVAFVGASGAGKSTTLLLLLRGSDPQEGSIKIDGIDLRNIDIDAYRRRLGVVEQHIVLFDDTIRRNVSFGLPDGALLTDIELDKLAKIARIDEFKDKLVDGWDTIIGENGIKLSGGQRQRVGIARALAKNPAIIILDEATSSLDAKNEALIKDALHDASAGRTTIMIAHRLSTIKDADRIFVFDKGEIVGVGKHEELLESCPTYADLVSHQTVLL